MFCSNCGAEISDGAKFCDSCGAPVSTGDADKTAAVPPAAPAPPVPSTPSQPGGARPHGSSIVAVVMSVVALVAVVALVVVVANPFGGPRDEPAQSVQEQPADDPAPAEEAEASDEEAEKDEAAEAGKAESEEDASADDASGDAVGTQQNNVVVVVEGNDRAPAPPASTVVHVNDDYILPYSATYEYSTSEISHLSDWELYLARNEIYARHGREFRNDDLVRYFSDKSWYTPTYSPDDFDARSGSILSYTEQRNAATILELEQARGSAYI
ncbi:YARHG domain-containing protein [Olsenella sp. SW781]|uniref:YARHG domain-containing protein n=1 Tax=Olsenella sp. SW781 TaxID=2530046 RepID=UPI00143A1DB4|nr:YARHG domain-containing protein [Olsenella sp. SW781]NJE80938.1 YARHG domain-containing protein [Olsenella sp. SW781]